MSLEIGTTEEVFTEPLKSGKRSISRGGGGSFSGGNNDGGNRGDGDDFNFSTPNEIEEFKPDKYRIGMGIILLIVLMTFGGLIATYVALATNHSLEWKPFDLPKQIWFSTVLIIISSVFYELGSRDLHQARQQKARKWFLLTSILGAIFIASQILSWMNLVNLGYLADGNPYLGFFYILTGVHAVHVFGGIISLGFIVLKTSRETKNADELLRRQWFARVAGWYWHFMGVLWIILFLLLGLYK